MRFHFVDRIDAVRKYASARGVKTVTFEEGFIDELSAEPGMIPRMLLIECAAQLVSWLVLYSTDFATIPLIAKIDEAAIECSVPCGTAMTLEVDVHSWNEDGALFSCGISLPGGRRIATGIRCLCTFIASRTLVDPDEMRARFRELAKDADCD